MILQNLFSKKVVNDDINQHIKNQLKKQRGLTLTEVGLAVAISAIIIVAALGIYGSVSAAAKKSSLRTQFAAAAAAIAIESNNGTLTSSSTLTTLKLPAKDPWGGAYTLDVSSVDTGSWSLSAASVPTDTCNTIHTSDTWTNVGIDCDTSSHTAKFTGNT